MSDQVEKMCPLCAEEMDLTDQQLKPCKCGYEESYLTWPGLSDITINRTLVPNMSDDLNLHGIFRFPKDLIPDILLRLPVKSLLRCRCVSKPWCSLIDSTHFVNKHLQRSIKCNPDSGMVVRAPKEGSDLYLADVDPLYDITATEMAEPLKTRVSGAEFVGSCNGLVCLWKDYDILLWNPATRKCRKLPDATNMPLPALLIGSAVIGFGYDHVNDDYKVMRTAVRDETEGIRVTVYSLKRDTWTRADTITCETHLKGQFGAHVDGTLYWLTYSDDYIVAFDLGVGKHRKIPYPNVDETALNCNGLTVFNSSLCIIAHYPGSRTNIWMMNNGVDNSWSELLSVKHLGILGSIKIMWPVAISKTGNEFLLEVDGNKFKWYEPESNEVKDATIHGFPDKFDSLVYTESLVSLCNDLKLDSEQLLKLAGEKKRQKQQQKKMMKGLTKGFKLKL